METFVALLRGINVGGHRKVAMADLRALATALGCEAPRTYVASGNLVVRSADAAADLASALERGVADRLGVADVPVVMRTPEELALTIAQNPLPEGAASPKVFLVYFLDTPLSESAARALEAEAEPFAPEELRVRGREVYVHYVLGSGRSRLAPVVARRLGPRATSRNWTTVLALQALATEASP